MRRGRVAMLPASVAPVLTTLLLLRFPPGVPDTIVARARFGAQQSAPASAGAEFPARRHGALQQLLRGGGSRRNASPILDPSSTTGRPSKRIRQSSHDGMPAASEVGGMGDCLANDRVDRMGHVDPAPLSSPCLKCKSPLHWYAKCPMVTAERAAERAALSAVESAENRKPVAAESLVGAGVAGQYWAVDKLGSEASSEVLGTALRAAARSGHTRTAMRLISERGADPNHCAPGGDPPIPPLGPFHSFGARSPGKFCRACV